MRISHLPVTLAVMLLATSYLQATPIVGLSVGNRIVTFDSATPGATSGGIDITGLASGHLLFGIDYRPIDGVLVGVGRDGVGNSQAYTIDTTTGVAMAFGNLFSTLPGTTFGIDFNPVPNALRIVTDGEANLRITNGGGGVFNTDTPLTRVAASPDPNLRIVSAAYSNNVPGGIGGATTLYVIDAFTGGLYRQGVANFAAPTPVAQGPNGGLLTLIGSLNRGTGMANEVGFDIDDQGNAFVSLLMNGGNQLFNINLSTGNTTLIGNIAGPNVVRDIAVAPTTFPIVIDTPEPSTILLSGLGLLGIGYLRRSKH